MMAQVKPSLSELLVKKCSRKTVLGKVIRSIKSLNNEHGSSRYHIVDDLIQRRKLKKMAGHANVANALRRGVAYGIIIKLMEEDRYILYEPVSYRVQVQDDGNVGVGMVGPGSSANGNAGAGMVGRGSSANDNVEEVDK